MGIIKKNAEIYDCLDFVQNMCQYDVYGNVFHF